MIICKYNNRLNLTKMKLTFWFLFWWNNSKCQHDERRGDLLFFLEHANDRGTRKRAGTFFLKFIRQYSLSQVPHIRSHIQYFRQKLQWDICSAINQSTNTEQPIQICRARACAVRLFFFFLNKNLHIVACSRVCDVVTARYRRLSPLDSAALSLDFEWTSTCLTFCGGSNHLSITVVQQRHFLEKKNKIKQTKQLPSWM